MRNWKICKISLPYQIWLQLQSPQICLLFLDYNNDVTRVLYCRDQTLYCHCGNYTWQVGRKGWSWDSWLHTCFTSASHLFHSCFTPAVQITMFPSASTTFVFVCFVWGDQGLLQILHLGITPWGDSGKHGVTGIKPGLPVSKASTISICPISFVLYARLIISLAEMLYIKK